MNRRGYAHTKVELLLRLADDPEGKQWRRAFITPDGHGKKRVTDICLILDCSRYGKEEGWMQNSTSGVKDRNPNPYNNTMDKLPELRTSYIEKALSELKRDSFIETSTIRVGKRRYKAYKLKCNTLLDIAHIFYFILDSEPKWDTYPGGYTRLKRFVSSHFFYNAFNKYMFDLIYFYNLWDAEKYPLSKRCCEEIFRKEVHTKSVISYLSSQHFNPFSGSDFPRFFRRFFPNEGPAKYERYLRENRIDQKFLMDLGLIPAEGPGHASEYFQVNTEVFEEMINLFQFMRKGMVISSETGEPRADFLDHWFDIFWYVGLKDYVDSMEGARNENSMIPRGDLTKNVCLQEWGKIRIGKHYFPNAFTIPILCSKHGIPFPNTIAGKYKVYKNNELTFYNHD